MSHSSNAYRADTFAPEVLSLSAIGIGGLLISKQSQMKRRITPFENPVRRLTQCIPLYVPLLDCISTNKTVV